MFFGVIPDKTDKGTNIDAMMWREMLLTIADNEVPHTWNFSLLLTEELSNRELLNYIVDYFDYGMIGELRDLLEEYKSVIIDNVLDEVESIDGSETLLVHDIYPKLAERLIEIVKRG